MTRPSFLGCLISVTKESFKEPILGVCLICEWILASLAIYVSCFGIYSILFKQHSRSQLKLKKKRFDMIVIATLITGIIGPISLCIAHIFLFPHFKLIDHENLNLCNNSIELIEKYREYVMIVAQTFWNHLRPQLHGILLKFKPIVVG